MTPPGLSRQPTPNPAAAATRADTASTTTDRRTQSSLRDHQWVVRLHNDDVHTFTFVADTLMRHALTRDVATSLTTRVDKEGIAEVHQGSLPSARAVYEALRTAGLLAHRWCRWSMLGWSRALCRL